MIACARLGRPGGVARLVADEVRRLVETVMTECRQWRPAVEWGDHRRHCEGMRAAAELHLFLADVSRKMPEDS